MLTTEDVAEAKHLGFSKQFVQTPLDLTLWIMIAAGGMSLLFRCRQSRFRRATLSSRNVGSSILLISFAM